MEFIIETPPELTGNAQEDLKLLREHIIDLQDELEYTLNRRFSDENR